MADELRAVYSHWITALVAEGFHGEELTEHVKEEAKDELGHAEKLANRIIELGGASRSTRRCRVASSNEFLE